MGKIPYLITVVWMPIPTHLDSHIDEKRWLQVLNTGRFHYQPYLSVNPLVPPLHLPLFMCTEYHTTQCPACGQSYLIYVEFCKDFRPPLVRCPKGTTVSRIAMKEGGCTSRLCPNGKNGGCSSM